MLFNLLGDVYGSVLVLFVASFAVIIYRKKIYIYEVPFLLTALGSLIIACFFVVYSLLMPELNGLLVNWGFLFFTSAVYQIGLHYESLYSLKPFMTSRNAIALVGVTLSCLLYLFNILNIPQFSNISFNYVFTTIFASAIFGYALWVIYHEYRISKSKSIILEFVAIFLNFIALDVYTVFLFIFKFIDPNISMDVFLISPVILSITGFSVYGYNFVHYRHIFRLPHPVYYLLMYSDVGIPIYFQRIHNNPDRTDDDELLPALFSAIQAFIQETLGRHEEISVVEGDMFQILFAPLADEKTIFSVITSQGSFYLNRAIKRFLKSVPQSLINKINPFNIQSRDLAAIRALLKNSFYFLDL